MARVRRNNYRSRRRVVYYSNAKRSLPPRRLRKPLPQLSRLTNYEDRRLWHPEGKYAAPKSFNKPRHRLVVPKVRGKVFGGLSISSAWSDTLPPAAIGFDVPKKVLICVRRRIRKEVMHALRKSGMRGQKRPRRGPYSDISCKG